MLICWERGLVWGEEGCGGGVVREEGGRCQMNQSVGPVN